MFFMGNNLTLSQDTEFIQEINRVRSCQEDLRIRLKADAVGDRFSIVVVGER
jgi:hypothetical protein